MKAPKRITRAWLLALADSIYNSKTRRFLRLCTGTLQNGPDPDTGKPMHCGLGELYFAMTGRQPHQDHVGESGVVDRAVKLAGLDGVKQEAVDAAIKAVKALKLPSSAEDAAIEAIENAAEETSEEDGGFADPESKFREALDAIPDENDEDTGYECASGEQSYEQYRNRACRVASQLRIAARCLPE